MATALTTPTQPAHTKQTLTLQRPIGTLVVDIWEPRNPSGEPPVLLIHGWGNAGSYWRNTAVALSETVQVIVPDLPGTGRSQPVSPPQNLFDQIRTLVYLLDELRLYQVQVVGHSMGAAMAVLLGDAKPDRVERIVMTSSCFFRTPDQVRTYQNVMRTFKSVMAFRPDWLGFVPGVQRAMASRYFYRLPDDPQVLRQGLMDYLTLDYDTAVACADDAPTEKIPEAGARLQMPVLLIAAQQDQVMPVENVDYTAEIIPDCTVRWIDQCGHLPMVEKPDEYMTHLQEFLRLGGQPA